MTYFVSGIVANPFQARVISSRLRSAGFADADVSILFPRDFDASLHKLEEQSKAPEGAAIGAGAGGALGAALGWLMGTGTVAVPGAGPFIATGPLLAALGGVAAGAALGGLAGMLVGLGIPEFEPRLYERSLQEGSYLISARCRSDHEVDLAEDVFRRSRAKEILSSRSVIAGT